GITNAAILRKTLKLTLSANAGLSPDTLSNAAQTLGVGIKFSKGDEVVISTDKEYSDFPERSLAFLEELAKAAGS
ncbi:MAG: hypothetical protein LBP51_04690, partial [Deferribacteraceae bacterium]|nr:hypothetical protein [Deferribacteraceae bacterium]